MQVVGYKNSSKTLVNDSQNLLSYISPMDLKNYGLIPEIIGRLPVLTHMNSLDKKSLNRRFSVVSLDSRLLTAFKNGLPANFSLIFLPSLRLSHCMVELSTSRTAYTGKIRCSRNTFCLNTLMIFFIESSDLN